MCNREKETGCRPNRHRSLAAKRVYLFRLWDESEIFQNFCLKPAGERRRKKWWKRVNAYQHLDLRDVNRAHYVSSFSVLFVSSLLFSIVLYSLLISLSLLIRSIWISLFSLGKSCCRFSALRWWELRLLNRLTYALCFRASLLLTRALPVLLLLLLLLLPMYYRCITRASCILSPSLGVCVCTIYHRTRAGKSEDEFENYSNRWDRSSCQRILWNRMGYTHPISNREVFSFFRFSVSFCFRSRAMT